MWVSINSPEQTGNPFVEKKKKIKLINDAERQFTESIDSRYTGAHTLAKIITDKQHPLLSVPSAPLLFYCV